jgi:hypothetical protein
LINSVARLLGRKLSRRFKKLDDTSPTMAALTMMKTVYPLEIEYWSKGRSRHK